MEVKISGATAVDKDAEKKFGKFDEWEINCAVRTLIEAEEIKADSEKMKYIRPLLEEKLQKTQKAITSLADLKEVAKAKAKG